MVLEWSGYRRLLCRDLEPGLFKYAPDQPRVPAGSGRASGRWGSAVSGDLALLGVPLAAARSSVAALFAEAAPPLVESLAAFAARIAVPTAILGALFIPTPNSGGVTEGTLPGTPSIRFRRDGPAGTLRLTTTTDDGGEIGLPARNRGGVYVDVVTDQPIGRDFGEQLDLDLDLGIVTAALAPRENDKPVAATDGPQLCPAPIPDVLHGAKTQALDFEDVFHARVNSIAPLPRGFAVRVIDPKTGEWQYPDDCFRYSGDVVDGDMKPGDFADAKGEAFAKLLAIPGVGKSVMDKLVDQAARHLRAAEAVGLDSKSTSPNKRPLMRFAKDFSTMRISSASSSV